MAGSDLAAGLMGALQGGLQGYGLVQRRKQDEEEQRRLAARQAVEDQIRMRQLGLQERTQQRLEDADLRGSYAQMLDDVGPGGSLTPNQLHEAQRLGLGHRVTTDRQVVEDPLGLEAIGSPVLPSSTGTPGVRPTAAQDAARQAGIAKAGATFQQEADARRTIEALPEHLRLPAQVGKLPTYGDEWQDPETRAAEAERQRTVKFEDWKRQQDYSHGQSVGRLKLSDTLQRTREAERETRGQSRRTSADASERAYQRAFDAYLRDSPEDYAGAAAAGDEAYRADQQLRADREGRPRSMGTPASPVVVGRGAPTGQPTRGAAPPAPVPYKPGDRVKTRDGRTVTVRRVLPDGRIETF
jgi:hypothetical protein